MATSKAFLEEKLQSANIKAALMAIRCCEGTSAADGYQYLFGCTELNKETFIDFSKHPNKRITKMSNGKPITSTAAGAYQILYGTYQELCNKYGFEDFEPHTQDLMCCAIFDTINVLEEVAAGNMLAPAVLDKLNGQWASLPGSLYGQPTKQLAQVTSYYLNAGGTIG